MPACPTHAGREIGSSPARGDRRGFCRKAGRRIDRAIVPLLVGLAAGSVQAAGIRLPEPGAREQSARELLLEPDPARGIQHGVVLELRAVLAHPMVSPTVIALRMRSKILSAEARSMGEIVIPYGGEDVRLERFWAFTIDPDGNVRELEKDDLEYRKEVEQRGVESGSYRGILPNVVPGSVVEFGWVVKIHGFLMPNLVLTRRWPVLSGVLLWGPTTRTGNLPGWVFLHPGRIDADIGWKKGILVVVARDVPAVVDEPYDPPEIQRKAIVRGFYVPKELATPDKYWQAQADGGLGVLQKFDPQHRQVGVAIQEMDLPEDAGLEEKLRLSYDWVQRHVENTTWKTGQGPEGARRRKEPRDTAGDVLRARRGTAWQIRWTWAAIAARLGAKVGVLWVVDRRKFGVFNENYLSMKQFAKAIVGVQLDDSDDAPVLAVDPGCSFPFGELPWWFQGTTAFHISRAGYASGRYRFVEIPSARASENAILTVASLRFDDDNELRRAEWSEEGTGQYRLDRRVMNLKQPTELDQALRRRCGESDTVEVLEARASGLDDPLGPWKLRCEVEETVDPIDPELHEYRVSLEGPWFVEAPDIGSPPRRTPVVFRYARRRVMRLEIAPPRGFAAGPLPDPVQVRSRYGRYQLAFARESDGRIVVHRRFELSRARVPLAEAQDLREFLSVVREADRTSIRFVPEDRSGAPEGPDPRETAAGEGS